MVPQMEKCVSHFCVEPPIRLRLSEHRAERRRGNLPNNERPPMPACVHSNVDVNVMTWICILNASYCSKYLMLLCGDFHNERALAY